MKTIIAGSRKGASYDDVYKAIQQAPWEVTTVISGTAKGVDELGELYAANCSIPVERYPARWNDINVPGAVVRTRYNGQPYNVAAGFQRNQLMANKADALIAVWDGESRGTKHMIETAKKRGLKIYIHKIGG